MTNEELTAIEARANAATLGPWATHDQGREDYSICRDNGNNTCCPLFERIGRDDDGIDGAFIAAARVDVPALIAEVRRLRVLADGLKEVIGLLRGSTVAGWCAECKGSGYITAHVSSANGGSVTTRKCVCGGSPFLKNSTAGFWLEER